MMNPPGTVTSSLVESWKHSLSMVGHAVCVHYQCQLCFLSLSGIVSHHRTCQGVTSQADYLPCLHCGARFKQFKSCQSHVERSHKQLFITKTERPPPSPHPTPPPLPSTPDVIPRSNTIKARRPDGTIVLLTPARSSSGRSTPVSRVVGTFREEQKFAPPPMKREESGGARMKAETSPRQLQMVEESQARSSSQGFITHRENVLVEKEIKLTQLESLVKQAEMKAEEARKARELVEWERDLQRRENEARRRLADAERMLRENSLADGRQDQYEDSHVILTPEDMDSLSPNSRPRNSVILPRSIDLSPTDSGGSVDSSIIGHSRYSSPPRLPPSNHAHLPPTNPSHPIFSTPHYKPHNPTYTSTPLLRLGHPNTIPIVLPSTAKLPPSAIRLTPHPRHHLPSPHSRAAAIPTTFTQDSPINLSKPRLERVTPTCIPSVPSPITSTTRCSPTPSSRMSSSPSPTLRPPCPPGSPVLRRALLAPLPTRSVLTLNPLLMSGQPLTPPTPTHSSPHSQPSTLPLSSNMPSHTPSPSHGKAVQSAPASHVSSSLAQSAAASSSVVPCVEITKDDVMEMQVGVVEDGSMDGGANISFPFDDSSVETSFLLSENLVLDQLLNSSGGRVLNMVATEGPDGMMTLVTQSEGGDVVQGAEVEVLENELDVIKKSMDEIQNEVDNSMANNNKVSPSKEDKVEEATEAVSGQNDQISVFSPDKLDRSRTTSAAISDMVEDSLDNLEKRIEVNTEENGGDLVDYFEMRLKEFESEIVQQGPDEEKVKKTVAKADATIIATKAAILETGRDNNILNTGIKPVMMDNSEELDKDEENSPEIDEENDSETAVEAENSINVIEANTIKFKKKRKRDCPGTAWFGSSSRRQVKKRKVDEVKKAEDTKNMVMVEKVLVPAVSAQGTRSSPHKKRRSGRLQRNNSKLAPATPPPSPPPPSPSASSTSKHQKSKLVNQLKKCKVEEASQKGALPLCTEELTLDKISDKSERKVRRKAATKAKGRVAEFVRQMKTKFEGESSEADADEDISEDSDDNYEVKNEAEVSALYKVVRNGAKRSCYQCGVCCDNFVSRGEVESHVLTTHQAQIVADDDDDDEYEDESGDDEEDSDPDYSRGKPRYKKYSDAPLTGPRRPLLEPCPDMVEREHNFRTKFYNLNDFPSLPVKMPDWVPVEQDTFFIPASSISARFTVTNLSKEQEAEVRILERFSGGLISNSPMMFCGGPVTAMAWCPMDKADKGDQVMALVAKLDYNPTSQSQEGGGKGLIQIWKMGVLRVEGGGEAPTFQFGIGHSYGGVRGVEWCPSGGRREGRLGLLGAACGDGTVRVWAIPAMDTMQEEGRIYQKEADMSLVCGEEEKVGECLSLSWYRGPGHNHVAASFSSGLVTLWDMSSTSILLREGSTLLPRQAWLAHTGSVTGLSLCPGEEEVPRYLVTGGSDRCYRFWDLRDTGVPLQEVKRGLVSGVRWLAGCSAASVSYDDVYLQGHTQTIITETGYYSSRPHPVIAQNSAVLDQDMSHWVGSIAIGTAAGELVVFVVPPVDKNMEHDKNLGQRKTYVFRTEVNKDKNEEEVDLRQYESMRGATTIKYLDMPGRKAGLKGLSKDDIKRVRVAERMDMEDLTCFPLASITKVAWNNNLGSQLLLASGGQAGLVRVHCVQALDLEGVVEDDDKL